MFGGGGGSPPPPQAKPVDTAEMERKESEATASQRKLKRARYGRQATRLTDPIVDLSNSRPNRASLLGGGEPPSTG